MSAEMDVLTGISPNNMPADDDYATSVTPHIKYKAPLFIYFFKGWSFAKPLYTCIYVFAIYASSCVAEEAKLSCILNQYLDMYVSPNEPVTLDGGCIWILCGIDKYICTEINEIRFIIH